MLDSKKLNRQLFLFIILFYAITFLVPVVFKFPKIGGGPPDAWAYLESLKIPDTSSWREVGHLPVSRRDAALLFAAVEKTSPDDGYLDGLSGKGVFAPGADLGGALLRDELYRFIEAMLALPGWKPQDDYFSGDNGGREVDMLARLGIIEVPFDRRYLPEVEVSLEEAVTSVARAVLPALRGSNAPVIVQPRQRYTYEAMERDLKRLASAYPELLELNVIGESVEGRQIYAVRLGRGEKEIFLDAAIHASEWLTVPLLMKMLEEYTHHASYGYKYGNYDLAALLQEVSFWFIPMLNPDGITLVLEGTDAVAGGSAVRTIQRNHESARDFSDWKANIRGVDLNRQFPASWYGMVNIKRVPSHSHYPGNAPLSEPEALALYDFTLERRPAMVISYHQRGEVIFWFYRQRGEQLERDRRIASGLSKVTGYGFDFYLTNGGKYRDWVITELGVPAIIMEVGQRTGDLSEWERIWRQNRYVGVAAAELLLRETR